MTILYVYLCTIAMGIVLQVAAAIGTLIATDRLKAFARPFSYQGKALAEDTPSSSDEDSADDDTFVESNTDGSFLAVGLLDYHNNTNGSHRHQHQPSTTHQHNNNANSAGASKLGNASANNNTNARRGGGEGGNGVGTAGGGDNGGGQSPSTNRGARARRGSTTSMKSYGTAKSMRSVRSGGGGAGSVLGVAGNGSQMSIAVGYPWHLAPSHPSLFVAVIVGLLLIAGNVFYVVGGVGDHSIRNDLACRPDYGPPIPIYNSTYNATTNTTTEVIIGYKDHPKAYDHFYSEAAFCSESWEWIAHKSLLALAVMIPYALHSYVFAPFLAIGGFHDMEPLAGSDRGSRRGGGRNKDAIPSIPRRICTAIGRWFERRYRGGSIRGKHTYNTQRRALFWSPLRPKLRRTYYLGLVGASLPIITEACRLVMMLRFDTPQLSFESDPYALPAQVSFGMHSALLLLMVFQWCMVLGVRWLYIGKVFVIFGKMPAITAAVTTPKTLANNVTPTPSSSSTTSAPPPTNHYDASSALSVEYEITPDVAIMELQTKGSYVRGSVTWTLWRRWRGPLIALGAVRLFQEILGLVPALLLRELVDGVVDAIGSGDHTSALEANLRHGAAIVIALIACSLLSTFIRTHYDLKQSKIGLYCRAVLSDAVYSHAAGLRPYQRVRKGDNKNAKVTDKKKGSSAANDNANDDHLTTAIKDGDVINHLLVDVPRICDQISNLNNIWCLPMQIGFALYLLYLQLEWGFLAGLFLTIAMVPTNALLAKKIGSVNVAMMKANDARVGAITEVVSNIKFVKMCGWSDAIYERVAIPRKAFMHSLSWVKYLDGICAFLWASTPVLVSLVSFITYAGVFHGDLTPGKVVASLALFNTLILPLNSYPWVLNGAVEAWVSVGRLDAFLHSYMPMVVPKGYYWRNYVRRGGAGGITGGFNAANGGTTNNKNASSGHAADLPITNAGGDDDLDEDMQGKVVTPIVVTNVVVRRATTAPPPTDADEAGDKEAATSAASSDHHSPHDCDDDDDGEDTSRRKQPFAAAIPSLTLHPGRLSVITGPAGSGKSTVLAGLAQEAMVVRMATPTPAANGGGSGGSASDHHAILTGAALLANSAHQMSNAALGASPYTSATTLASSTPHTKQHNPIPPHLAVAYLPQEAFVMDASIRANITFHKQRAISHPMAIKMLRKVMINDVAMAGGRNAYQRPVSSYTMIAKAVAEALLDKPRYERILLATCLDGDVSQWTAGDMRRAGEKGEALSGGQKHRVALARALYADADVYLLDDFLGALDANVSATVVNNVIGALLAANKHVLMVSEHPEVLAMAKRSGGTIYTMRDGVLVGGGSDATANNSSTSHRHHQHEVSSSSPTLPQREDAPTTPTSMIDNEDAFKLMAAGIGTPTTPTQLGVRMGTTPTNGNAADDDDETNAIFSRTVFGGSGGAFSGLRQSNSRGNLSSSLHQQQDPMVTVLLQMASADSSSAAANVDTSAIDGGFGNILSGGAGHITGSNTITPSDAAEWYTAIHEAPPITSVLTAAERSRRRSFRKVYGTPTAASPSAGACDNGGGNTTDMMTPPLSPTAAQHANFTVGEAIPTSGGEANVTSPTTAYMSPASAGGITPSTLAEITAETAPSGTSQPPTSSNTKSGAINDEDDTNEVKEVGSISFGVVWGYIVAMGIPLFLFVVSFLVAMQAVRNYSDVYVAMWASDHDKKGTNNGGSSGNSSALQLFNEQRPTSSAHQPYSLVFANHVTSFTTNFVRTANIFDDDSNNDSSSAVNSFLKFMALLAAVNVVLAIIRGLGFAFAGLRACMVIHDDVVSRVIGAPFSFFSKVPRGRLINRLSRDIYAIDDSLPFMFNIFLAQLFMLIGAIVVIGVTSSFAVLGGSIPIVIILYFIQKPYRRVNRELKRLESAARSPIVDHLRALLEGGTIMRCFGGECVAFYVKKARRDYAIWHKLTYNLTLLQWWFNLDMQLIGVGIVALVGIITVIVNRDGKTDQAASMGLALAYVAPLTNYISNLLGSFTELEKLFISVERIEEYRSLETENSNYRAAMGRKMCGAEGGLNGTTVRTTEDDRHAAADGQLSRPLLGDQQQQHVRVIGGGSALNSRDVSHHEAINASPHERYDGADGGADDDGRSEVGSTCSLATVGNQHNHQQKMMATTAPNTNMLTLGTIGAAYKGNKKAIAEGLGRVQQHFPLMVAAQSSSHKNNTTNSNRTVGATITLNKVLLRYTPNGPLVLKGISTTIHPHEKVALVGRTGSGKSSLIMALLGLVPLAEERGCEEGTYAPAASVAIRMPNTALTADDNVSRPLTWGGGAAGGLTGNGITSAAEDDHQSVTPELSRRESLVGGNGANTASYAEPFIAISGIDIRLLEPEWMRRQITVLPQECLVLEGTIYSNMDTFGKRVERVFIEEEDDDEYDGNTSSLGIYGDEKTAAALKKDRKRRSFLPPAEVYRRTLMRTILRAIGMERFSLFHHVSAGGSNLSAGERHLLSIARIVFDCFVVEGLSDAQMQSVTQTALVPNSGGMMGGSNAFIPSITSPSASATAYPFVAPTSATLVGAAANNDGDSSVLSSTRTLPPPSMGRATTAQFFESSRSVGGQTPLRSPPNGALQQQQNDHALLTPITPPSATINNYMVPSPTHSSQHQQQQRGVLQAVTVINLANAPKKRKCALVVVDEPAACLDGVSEARLWALISEVFADSTLVAITHKLDSVVGGIKNSAEGNDVGSPSSTSAAVTTPFFDRVLVMDSGRIIADGTPAAMVRDGVGPFASLLREAVLQ